MRSMKARLRSVKTRFGFRARINEDASSLCSECKFIFDHWYDRDTWSSAYPKHSHRHIVGLHDSSQNGCPVCTLLLRGLSHATVEQLQRNWPDLKGLVTVARALPSLSKRYEIKLIFHPDPDNSESENPLVATIDALASAGDSTAVGIIQNVADAEENWELIKKWLYICQKSHTKCRQNKALHRQLPTRLIEVGDTDMDLRLCETLGLPQESQYLTLSHSWGGKVFTTLTRRNFEEFLSHIPTDSLSKTFREAIVTTRRLGFKYLWVDSLCIIQGDEVDWTKEASRMEIVYSNSALNIAASAAPNGDFGCFSTRIPGQIYGCTVATRDGPANFDTTVWDITVEHMTSKLWNNVLNTRAWVFQETFLAPKTIHFTSGQLLWECVSTRSCETFPNSYDDGTNTLPSVRYEYWNESTLSIAIKWLSVVIEYSNKKVTFDKDKLVALSGVARLFAARFGTTYIAGLWKEDLITQLIWRTLEQEDGGVRNSIPSWSWAAVNTRIARHDSHGNRENRPLASVLEATTSLVDETFGDVKGGMIRLSCPLPFPATVVEELGPRLFLVRLQSLTVILDLYADRTRYYIGQVLYLLPLVRSVDWDPDEWICGLVIEPVQPASYQRTGFFEVYGEPDLQYFLEAQKIASCEDNNFFGEALDTVDEEGRNMCNITLI